MGAAGSSVRDSAFTAQGSSRRLDDTNHHTVQRPNSKQQDSRHQARDGGPSRYSPLDDRSNRIKGNRSTNEEDKVNDDETDAVSDSERSDGGELHESLDQDRPWTVEDATALLDKANKVMKVLEIKLGRRV
ncbi:hypothetical protein K490DRAFT_68121 [Saccharata proteae CBS 121410]|uniref:Uncharacterized protein n=1 Tax=Saccharata proteae CBS 121410 TaxID=1314787 RepID=A0A9P4LUN6_9PEZI|nr:hypothetical protein K490DRAFT_68121 [Saccharata proteae CBS 121410]